jgi:hypothetical protein
LEENVPAADLERARAVVQADLLPCDDVTIAAELLRLRLTTQSKDIGDIASDVLVAIFTDICREYPKDVVVDAMRTWSRSEVFWPAEARIRKLLDERVRRRRSLLSVLETRLREINQGVLRLGVACHGGRQAGRVARAAPPGAAADLGGP